MIKTRFAPSPTGVLHIGSIRTALFCWLYARHTDGKFVLRIEDTDAERSTQANVDAILEGMSWLGLDADEGPYFQSQRYDRYRDVCAELLQSGHAYHCYCSRDELDEVRSRQMAAGEKTKYNGRCRNREDKPADVKPVVRFKTPETGQTVINDLVRGTVVFDNAELDDLVIMRSDGSPTYNFSVVVDDSDMGITHVIRGDDHLNNTPRQANMFAALGFDLPTFAHLPMILGTDGAKLSKRHGAVDVRDYRDQGYLPEALLNYLVRLGWSSGDQEIFTRDEMIRLFDIADVNHSASAFNPEKLDWVNQQYVMNESAEKLGALLAVFLKNLGLDPANGPSPADVANAYRERAVTLTQMAESARYCYADRIVPDAAAAKKNFRPVVLEPMRTVRGKLADLKSWTEDELAAAIDESAAEHEIGMGKLGQPLRVAVSGGPVSPPIDITLALVGRERSLARIDVALAMIEERARQNA